MKLQLDIDSYTVAGGAALYVVYRAVSSARVGSKWGPPPSFGPPEEIPIKHIKCVDGDFEDEETQRSENTLGMAEPEAEPTKTPEANAAVRQQRCCFLGGFQWFVVVLLSICVLLAMATVVLAVGRGTPVDSLLARLTGEAEPSALPEPVLGVSDDLPRNKVDAFFSAPVLPLVDQAAGNVEGLLPLEGAGADQVALEASGTSGSHDSLPLVPAVITTEAQPAKANEVPAVITTEAQPAKANEVITVKLSRQHGLSRDGDILIYKSAYYGTLDIGSPAVPFTFVFDTGSGHLVLPSTFCRTEACKVHKRYKKSASETAVDIDFDGTPVAKGQARDQLTVQFGTGEITGVFVEDRVCFNKQAIGDRVAISDGAGDVQTADPNMPDGCVQMRFVSAVEMSPEPFRTFEFDGVLGLGLDSLSQTPEFNFIHMMAKAAGMGWQDNGPPLFAIFLAAAAHETSELNLGGYAEDHLENGAEDIKWSPVLDAENGHWMVKIKSLRVNNEVIPFCEDGCKAVLDSGTALLAVPSASFSELYRGLWHTGNLDGECLGDGPQLHFELEDLTITLGPEDYARPEKYKNPRNYQKFGQPETRRNDLYCRPLLMSMDMAEPIGPKLFILGEPVLRKYYTVYDAKEKRVGLGKAHHAPVPPVSPGADDADDAWFYEEDTEE